MATLNNEIRIDAPGETVWAALTALDALHHYDPGVRVARVLDGPRSGIGASRQCDLKPRGWFRERITEWTPGRSVAFELTECSLPVRRLSHRYSLETDESSTVVRQHMDYRLKFGPLGVVLDRLVVRKKWDAGIRGFLSGLKHHVEQRR